jgi:hypothetical protein
MTTRRRQGLRKTRKGGSTVEGLHNSMKRLDAHMKAVLTKDPSAARAHLEKKWLEFFGASLTPAAAKGLIVHYEKLYGRRATRKAARQRGGMAPINYMMGQGSTDFTYGRFPTPMSDPQVIRALDLPRFSENRGGRTCDSTGGFDPQAGGGLFDSLANGYLPASVPRNLLETGVSAFSSRPIADGNPSPVKAHVELASPPNRIFNSVGSSIPISPIHRAT